MGLQSSDRESILHVQSPALEIKHLTTNTFCPGQALPPQLPRSLAHGTTGIEAGVTVILEGYSVHSCCKRQMCYPKNEREFAGRGMFPQNNLIDNRLHFYQGLLSRGKGFYCGGETHGALIMLERTGRALILFIPCSHVLVKCVLHAAHLTANQDCANPLVSLQMLCKESK